MANLLKMRKFLALIVAWGVVGSAWGQDPAYDPPAGYYDSAAGLAGGGLKAALHEIIDDHVRYPYSSSSTDTWNILRDSDQDPNNPDNVILVYNGASINGAQEYNGGAGWNREHVWPQSLGGFNTSVGPGTDCHNLKPSNETINSQRGNLEFDDGGAPYTYGGLTQTYKDSNSFESNPAFKGDLARIIFYMAVRYEGDAGEPDLEVDDFTNGGTYTFGKLSTLLLWHALDPVDEFERRRNSRIAAYQGNRNPFIDHPEYVEAIWNAGVQTPVITSFFPVSGSPGTTVTLIGYNFGTAPTVRFNGSTATATVLADGTQINAIVPVGASSGPITVTGSGGTDTSTANFTVQSLATVNLQWPPRMNLGRAGEGTVYAQVYLPGRTEGALVASNVLAWIGVHDQNTDPSGWPSTAWIPATRNLTQDASAPGDEYLCILQATNRIPGTYSYAARWQVDVGAYQYGGITPAGAGGLWGAPYGNGVLTVRASAIDWANLQWPPSGQVALGGSFTVYARVYRAGVTPTAGAPGGNFRAQIGVSLVDENPESSSAFTWLEATYGSQYGNDDEFQRTLTGLAPGTYRYASRFSDDGGATWTYGGILADGSGGGVWDGTTYAAGVLTVGSTIGNWSSNAPVNPELVGKYAIGGAANLSAASESPLVEAQANTLSLTAMVRKDDPKLMVEAEWVTDLAGGWSTIGVSSATNGLSQPTDPGWERRKFTVPYDPANEPRKFLRLKATLAP